MALTHAGHKEAARATGRGALAGEEQSSTAKLHPPVAIVAWRSR